MNNYSLSASEAIYFLCRAGDKVPNSTARSSSPCSHPQQVYSDPSSTTHVLHSLILMLNYHIPDRCPILLLSSIFLRCSLSSQILSSRTASTSPVPANKHQFTKLSLLLILSPCSLQKMLLLQKLPSWTVFEIYSVCERNAHTHFSHNDAVPLA